MSSPKRKPKGKQPQAESLSPVIPDDSLDFSQDSLDTQSGDSLGENLDNLMDVDKPPPVAEDPFAGIQYSGDAQDDSLAEMAALNSAFSQRAKADHARFVAATDSEYWFAVCFQSRAQKEAFLKALHWLQHGDKYLDGTLLAELLGVELPEAHLPFVKEKPDRTLNELALPLE